MNDFNEKRPKFYHAVNIVTMACNLKCELCILYVPYYRTQWHPTLEFVNEVTDRAFAMGDYECFEFNGGEPLLRKDLADIYEHAYKYIDNADRFKTVTNGTTMPDGRLINIWKKYGNKFHCIVDDYGEKLSSNAVAVVEKLRSEGISCELRDMHTENKHHGGWVDFRADEPKWKKEELKEVYANCSQVKVLKHCCNIIRGILMPCHLQFQVMDRGICEPAQNEFIDLFDESESLEDKRKKMEGIQKLPYLRACAWCPGFNDDTPRCKPAIQLDISKAEIENKLI